MIHYYDINSGTFPTSPSLVNKNPELYNLWKITTQYGLDYCRELVGSYPQLEAYKAKNSLPNSGEAPLNSDENGFLTYYTLV